MGIMLAQKIPEFIGLNLCPNSNSIMRPAICEGPIDRLRYRE